MAFTPKLGKVETGFQPKLGKVEPVQPAQTPMQSLMGKSVFGAIQDAQQNIPSRTNVTSENPILGATGIAVGAAKTAIERPFTAAKLGLSDGASDIVGRIPVIPGVLNMGQLTRGSLSAMMSLLSPEAKKQVHDTALEMQQGLQKGVETPEALKRTTSAERLGEFGEKTAEMFAGAGLANAASATGLARIPAVAQNSIVSLITQGLQNGQITAEEAKNAVTIGALSQAGKIPNAIFGGTQMAEAGQQATEGDYEGAIQNAVMGAMGLHGAMKQKGWILDRPLTAQPTGVQQVKGQTKVGMQSAFEPEGNIIQKFGKRMQMNQVRPTARDVDNGFDVNNIAKYDVGGSVKQSWIKTNERIAGYGEQLHKIKQEYGDPMVIDLNRVYQDTVAALTAKGKSFHQEETQAALAKLQREIELNHPEWKDQKVSFTDAWTAKYLAGDEAAIHSDPFKKGSETPTESVWNEFYRKLKVELEKNAPPQYAEVNKALTELIPIRQAIYRQIPVAKRNNVLSLHDVISGVASAANPSVIPLAFAQKLLRSGNVADFLAKLGTVEKPFIPGEVPPKPQYPQLPSPRFMTGSPPANPMAGDTSGIYSQAEATARLREQGSRLGATPEEQAAHLAEWKKQNEPKPEDTVFTTLQKSEAVEPMPLPELASMEQGYMGKPLPAAQEIKQTIKKENIDAKQELQFKKEQEKQTFLENKNPYLDNARVLDAIKNHPSFIKEGQVKDIMGEGAIMQGKDGRYRIADTDAMKAALIKKGYKNTGLGVDSLAKEAGYENGQEYLNAVLEQARKKKAYKSE